MSASVTDTNTVIDTLKYVRRFTGKRVMIKLGGAALEDQELVRSICSDLMLMRSVGVPLIIVHGGGPAINRELKLHGIDWKFVEGLRVTTPEMMEVIEMVLCGYVNRRIVRTLNQAGVPAVGLSGGDALMLQCTTQSPQLGLVGSIQQVDPVLIESILKNQSEGNIGTIPVIAPVGVGDSGESMNINADWAASRIAQKLTIKKLFYLTDVEGILDAKGNLIPELDAAELEKLIEKGVVQGGMLAKANSILEALRNGVEDVHVLNARQPHGLIQELFTQKGVGTVCRLRTTKGNRKTKSAAKEAGLS